jgi:hypothetical protein
LQQLQRQGLHRAGAGGGADAQIAHLHTGLDQGGQGQRAPAGLIGSGFRTEVPHHQVGSLLAADQLHQALAGLWIRPHPIEHVVEGDGRELGRRQDLKQIGQAGAGDRRRLLGQQYHRRGGGLGATLCGALAPGLLQGQSAVEQKGGGGIGGIEIAERCQHQQQRGGDRLVPLAAGQPVAQAAPG